MSERSTTTITSTSRLTSRLFGNRLLEQGRDALLGEDLLEGFDGTGTGCITAELADYKVFAVVVCYDEVICPIQLEQISTNNIPWLAGDLVWEQGFFLL